MDEIRKYIDEVRAEHAASTQGEWESALGEVYLEPMTKVKFNWLASDTPWQTGYEGSEQAWEDAEFIAHAHQHIPRLLSALEVAVQLISDYEGYLGPKAAQATFRQIEAIIGGEE